MAESEILAVARSAPEVPTAQNTGARTIELALVDGETRIAGQTLDDDGEVRPPK